MNTLDWKDTRDDEETMSTHSSGEFKLRNVNLLASWKEIATYVGRGIRTVQRWEIELDFPVRRTHGKATKAGIVAMRTDIDAWLQARQIGRGAHESDRVKRLLRFVEELQLESHGLRRQLEAENTEQARGCTAPLEQTAGIDPL